MKVTMSHSLLALMLSLGLITTGCSKHEEGKVEATTEEIAAKQGEAARAANPAPAAKEPAKFVASAPAATNSATASTSATTTTTTSTMTTASAPANTATAAAQPASDAGEKLYATTCKTCHETGLAGAPKFGDKAAWKDRIAQGNDTLHKHAIAGFTGKAGTMPPKGGSTAPDEEVKAAVDYMVSKAK